MKKAVNYLLMGVLVLAGYNTIWASVQSDIEKANKKGKTVFNAFVEPQWSVADKGPGWPEWQVFVGFNMQFLK